MTHFNQLILCTLVAFLSSVQLNAQNVTIPDAAFKAYLVGDPIINTNGDTEIQVTEANAYIGPIYCPFLSINDLTGIEAFVGMTDLDCSFNNLSTLDLSSNASLTSLNCSGSGLTFLDLSSNASLTSLDCSANILTALDLSLLTNLTSFDCTGNDLRSLNVKNGNNSNFIYFAAELNSYLYCIDVDDVTYSTTNWTIIDANASFNLNCTNAPIVNIPNVTFKNLLITNTDINVNGDTEIQVAEANYYTGNIDCSNLGINDLTGIEAFNNISLLYCNNNQLTTLDVSQNTSLMDFDCSNNQLTTLDVSQNVNLGLFYCRVNQLTTLDVSQNVSLTDFYCYSNPLTVLDVSQNTNLRTFSCHSTQITTLDLSQNTALTSFWCDNNPLTSLNVKNGNNTGIVVFYAINNPNLTCIEVDDVAYSTANWFSIDSIASFSTNCGVVAVDKLEQTLENIAVFPNPTTQSASVVLGKVFENINIQVSTITGQVVLEQTHYNKEILSLEIEGNNGLYFVTIQTESGSKTIKVLKQ